MKIKKKSNTVRVPPLPKTIKVKRDVAEATGGSTVHKALQNVKKVLQKKKTPVKTTVKKDEVNKLQPQRIAKPKKVKRLRKPKVPNERGVVYVGHIPHGFFEDQLRQYFNQFGRVTRARVARSENTGRSRGYGYIEFAVPGVAEVAAETMNNYLMCGRLLKATYIPPENQHHGFFAGKNWSKQEYPKLKRRKKVVAKNHASITEEQHKRFERRTVSKLASLEEKLRKSGIEINLNNALSTKS